jgi:hypothetical protein
MEVRPCKRCGAEHGGLCKLDWTQNEQANPCPAKAAAEKAWLYKADIDNAFVSMLTCQQKSDEQEAKFETGQFEQWWKTQTEDD